MNQVDTIGIVGASGDLGSRLTLQACAANFDEVLTYDVREAAWPPQSGVDPDLSPHQAIAVPRALRGLDAIVRSCDVIHWCAPIYTANDIPRLPFDATLVLHDSVMSNSRRAAIELSRSAATRGRIVLAHCLMNEEKKVVVGEDFIVTDFSLEHFRRLGLDPMSMKVEEHDYVMAHSQAPLALLSLALRNDLSEYAKSGLLTPSARELQQALDDRAARWTEHTLTTILSNPQLRELLVSLQQIVGGVMANVTEVLQNSSPQDAALELY